MFRLKSAIFLACAAVANAGCSTPEPTTLASGRDQPWAIAVYGDSVYFSERAGGTIARVGTNGGAVTTLAAGQLTPTALVTDGRNVYWSTSDGSVMLVPVAGGEPTMLAKAQSNPNSLATDGVNVYFIDEGSQSAALMEVPVDGGAPVALVSNVVVAGPIAVDATSVYFFTPADERATYWNIKSVPIDGGPSMMLADSEFEPIAIAVDATSVYVEAGQPIPHSEGTFVTRIPKVGGTPTNLARFAVGLLHQWPTGFAVDSTHVYFVDSDFMKVPTGGGAVEPFAIGVGGDVANTAIGSGDVGGFALDAKFVYWTTPTVGTVSKTPKSP